MIIEFIRKIIDRGGNKLLFKNISMEWLSKKKGTVKKSTYTNYLYIIEKYLNPEFGEKEITKIKDYNIFIQNLNETLSPKYIRDITNILKAILNYYEEEYEIKLTKRKMNLPKVEKNRLQILTTKEKQKIENYCIKSKSLREIGILMSLNTGMRIGEICALKWENIDLDERSIYVKYTLQRIYNKETRKTEVIIDTPKSTSSVRAIPINKKLYDLLKPLKRMYKKNAFFLTGMENKYLEPRSYRDSFKYVLKQCKVRRYKFHILRHTFATNCIEIGMDIKTLSEIL